MADTISKTASAEMQNIRDRLENVSQQANHDQSVKGDDERLQSVFKALYL